MRGLIAGVLGAWILVAVGATGWADVACGDYGLPVREAGRIATPAGASRIAVSPGWAFAITGGGNLAVIDLSDPQIPVIVSHVTLPAGAADIDVCGTTLLVSLGNAGLAAYDVSAPAAPVLLGTLTGLGRKDRIAIAPPYAYVSGDSLHVFALDAGPLPVRRAALPLRGASLCVDGDLLALANGSVVKLVSLADPEHPASVGTQEFPYNYENGMLEVTDVALRAGKLLAATELIIWYEPMEFSTMEVVDVSDPAVPRRLTMESLFGAGELALAGDCLYALSSGGQLELFATDQPPLLRCVWQLPLGLNCADLAVSGTLAGVAAGQTVAFLRVADRAPTAGALGSAPLFRPRSARLDGSRAFIADDTAGLKVLDLTNPSTPELAATVPVDGAIDWAAREGAWLYALAHRGSGADLRYRLQIYGLDDPWHPVLAGEADLPDRLPTQLAPRGRFVWTAGDSGLAVWDCRLPAAPSRARSWALPVAGIAIDGDRLYAVGADTLRVFGFSDSVTVVLRGASPGPGNVVAAADGRVCVAKANGTLFQDIVAADPAAPVRSAPLTLPTVLGRPTSPFSWGRLALANGHAYVAAGAYGAFVVDLRDPLEPAYAGTAALAEGSCSLVDADDGLVLVVAPAFFSPSIALTFAAQCRAWVPNYLASFAARREKSGIDVAWSVTEPTAAADFSLTGSDGEAEWTVPHDADGPVAFAARDRSTRALAGAPLVYRLRRRDSYGAWAALGETRLEAASLPVDCRLSAPCPNPFNPRTTLRFDLPSAGQVRLSIYDVHGRLVRALVRGQYPAGTHTAVWDGRDSGGRDASSGAYFARMEAEGKIETVRMTLVR